MIQRSDPGPCPICGASHTACTTGTGPIMVAQLPARDAAQPAPAVTLKSEAVTLAPGQFSTATYRGKKR